MLVEKFDGQPVDEVQKFTADDMLELCSAAPDANRQKCCLLPWRVLAGGDLFAGRAAAECRAPSHRRREQHERLDRPLGRLDPPRSAADFPILASRSAATCRWSISTTPPARSGRGR